MRKPLPPLNGLRAFEAAARHLSFQGAASELHVSPAAIGQSIRTLESHLGLQLFTRLTRQVVLTDAGQTLASPLTDGFNTIAEGVHRLQTLDQPDRLTISTTISFAEKWLLPRLPDFNQLYPDLDVRIISTDQQVDFATEKVDLAVRFGRGHYKGLVAEPITNNIYFPVCSPDLLPPTGPGLTPEDLFDQTLIHTDWLQESAAAPTWNGWFKQVGVQPPAGQKGLRLSVETLAVTAAIDGLGIALVHEVLVEDDLEKGVLVKPFDGRFAIVPDFKYFIVHPEADKGSAKIASIKTWLYENISRNSPRISRNDLPASPDQACLDQC